MADETPYITVPLTTDPAQLRDDAIAELQALVPGWNPDAGDLARWIIEASALAAAEAREVASQLPALAFGAWGEDLLGLPPVQATAATVPSTWTAVDTAGYTIPAGTTVGIRTAGDELVAFRVTAAVTIPAASSATLAGEVILQAVEPGEAANGITGTVELIDALAGIQSVALVGTPAGGADDEDADTYLARLRGELQTLSRTPILPRDFEIQARSVPGVARAVAVDMHDPAQPIVLDTDTFDATIEGWVATALTGWHTAADTGVTRVTTAPKAGAGHALIDVTGGGQGGHAPYSPGAGFDAGETYQAELWVRLASGTGNVDLLFGATTTDRASVTLAATATYQKVTVTWTALADAATGYVAAVPAGNTDVYVDEVRVLAPNYAVERAVTVILADDAGQPCTSGTKTAADALLQARRETSFIVAIADPKYRAIDVTFTAVALDGYTIADVEAAAEAAVTEYLNPAGWGVQVDQQDPSWAAQTHVRHLEVAQVINATPGVHYITALTLNGAGADILLPRPGGLPTAGTITGTITAP